MMKKTISLLLVCLLLLGCVPLAAASGCIVIDKTWHILVPETPTAAETFAAEKLAGVFGEVFGEAPAIVSQAEKNYIALGAASEADVSGVADNGYRIRAIGGNVHIAGTAQRGLQIAAYRFLEEFCHRKVYTSTITVLPKSDTVFVPTNTDIVYEPFFESTDTDWKSPLDTEYSMANGLTNGARRTLSAEMGGTVDYLGGFCHTMGTLCETEKYIWRCTTANGRPNSRA